VFLSQVKQTVELYLEILSKVMESKMEKLPKWEKKGLIYSQSDGVFFKSHTTRPIPYLLNNKCLRIFFSSRNDDDIPYPSYIDVNPENPAEIIYVNQEPLIDIGRVGTFDDSGVTPVSILTEPSTGKLLMYYVGWKRRRYGGVSIEASIGLAEIIKNGTRLKRLFEGPILAQDIDHPILTAAPFVVPMKSGFRMWYCSGTEWRQTEHGSEMLYSIYVADSDNGIKWKQIKSSPVISYCFDGEVVSAPWVIKTPSGLIMWYSYRGTSSILEKNYSPGIATSKDGINWDRHDNEIGILKSNSGWDSEMICYPAIFNYNDKTYMFYSGNGVGKAGIGYAIADRKLDIIGW
jgi:hypothetical protein